MLEVDQTPIGDTTPCPATYIGFWDTIRQTLPTRWRPRRAAMRQTASPSTPARGAAPAASQGIRTIAMSFLPDVKVLCETCKGARFNPETLAVTWRSKNIGDVLQMEVDEAVDFFAAMPSIAHPLQLLKDVGLGGTSRWGNPRPRSAVAGAAHQARDGTLKVRDDIGPPRAEAPHTPLRAGRGHGGPVHERCGKSSSTCCTAWSMAPQRGGD